MEHLGHAEADGVLRARTTVDGREFAEPSAGLEAKHQELSPRDGVADQADVAGDEPVQPVRRIAETVDALLIPQGTHPAGCQ